MDLAEILEILPKGEGPRVEFKVDFPKQSHDLAKEMIAFANTDGGILLLGVSDDGRPIGVPEAAKALERISGIARSCSPPLWPDIGRVAVDDTTSVIYARIPPSGPCSYKGTFSIRVGSTCCDVAGSDLAALMEKRRQEVGREAADQFLSQKGMLAIMFTDIVGSTSLQAEPGISDKSFVENIRQKHDAIVEQCVREHGGIALKHAGDGYLICFVDPQQALASALAIQRRLNSEPIATPLGRNVQVKIGIHFGGPIRMPDPATGSPDIVGRDVSLTQRIQSIARGGQILLSEKCARLVEDGSAVRIVHHGRRLLPGIGLTLVSEAVSEGASPNPPPGGLRGTEIGGVSDYSEFVGRENEVTTVLDALNSYRLVSVTGEGGVGKTRVALEAASRYCSNGSALAIVSLENLNADTEVALLDAVAASLMLGGEDPGRRREAIHALLLGRPTLLLVDNCETARTAIRPFIRSLITLSSDLRILATSIPPIVVAGERRILLDPMQTPAQRVDNLAELRTLDSFKLFEYFAGHFGWKACDAQAPSLCRLLRLTDGIPLAIELVSAWIPLRELGEIVESLEQRPLGDMTRVEEGYVEQARHQSLQRCLEWSVDLLSTGDREGFKSLGVFGDSFDPESVTAICQFPEAQKLLDNLTRFRLIRRESAENRSRYSMPRFSRAYAEEQFASLTHAPAIQARYVGYFIQAVSGTADARNSDTMLDLDWKNLYHAAEIAANNCHWGAVAKLSRILSPFLLQRGLWSERKSLNQLALNAARMSQSQAMEHRVLLDLGVVLARLGEKDEAVRIFQQSLVIVEQKGNTAGQIRVLDKLATLYMHTGNLPAASSTDRKRAALQAMEDGGPRSLATALDREGRILISQGRWTDAGKKFEQSMAIRQQREDDEGIAHSHGNLAQVYQHEDRWNEAAQSLDAALRIWKEMGHLQRQAIFHMDLGELYMTRGWFGKAETELLASVQARAGDPKDKCISLTTLGKLYRRWEKWEAAQAIFNEAVAIAKALGDTESTAQALDQLGIMHTRQHEWTAAITSFNESISLKRGVNPVSEAYTLDQVAKLYSETGKWGEAEDALKGSLQLSMAAEKYDQAAITMVSLALVAAARGNKAVAVSHASAAVSLSNEKTQDRKARNAAAEILRRLENYMEEGRPWTIESIADRAYETRRRHFRYLVDVSRQMGQLQDAEDVYRKSLEKARESGNWIDEAILLNELGSIVRRAARLDAAKELHIRSLRIFQDHKISRGEADALHKLAKTYAATQRWPAAELAYKRSISIKEKLKNKTSEMISHDSLGEAYEEQGRLALAIDSFISGHEIARKIGTGNERAQTARNLVRVYRKADRLDDAKAVLLELVGHLESRRFPVPDDLASELRLLNGTIT